MEENFSELKAFTSAEQYKGKTSSRNVTAKDKKIVNLKKKKM